MDSPLYPLAHHHHHGLWEDTVELVRNDLVNLRTINSSIEGFRINIEMKTEWHDVHSFLSVA